MTIAFPSDRRVFVPLVEELTGDSALVRRAREVVSRAAMSDDPVLIVAEPGFSTEAIARTIHHAHDPAAPLAIVDCAAGPPAAVAASLFGHTASARGDREAIHPRSQLGLARCGTIFLRNVAELPAASQVRLDRLLRDGEMSLPSGLTTFDVRVIASATPSIDQDARQGRFRPELHRRLQALRVDVPTLDERSGDMPAIVQSALQSVCASLGRAVPGLAPAALTALSSLPWPGNLDELRAVLARILDRLPSGALLRQEDVLATVRPRAGGRQAPSRSLRDARADFEREYIVSVLEEHRWRMAEAARVLGIERANLYRKTRQLGISRTTHGGERS